MTKRRGQTIQWPKEEDRQCNDKKKKDKNDFDKEEDDFEDFFE
jgi:hypothetical protein